MKQIVVGQTWRRKDTKQEFVIDAIVPSKRFACYIRMGNWLLPPRYFWDMMEKVNADI